MTKETYYMTKETYYMTKETWTAGLIGSSLRARASLSSTREHINKRRRRVI